jgi:hypothetical protein
MKKILFLFGGLISSISQANDLEKLRIRIIAEDNLTLGKVIDQVEQIHKKKWSSEIAFQVESESAEPWVVSTELMGSSKADLISDVLKKKFGDSIMIEKVNMHKTVFGTQDV